MTEWTASEVARYLGVSPASLQAFRLDGSFPQPGFARSGQLLWRPADVRVWAATHLDVLHQRRGS